MKVTKITIGRLYNLGNYEHIRYEISVELQLGQSATVALGGMEKILDALNPKPPRGVKSAEELDLACQQLKAIEAMPDYEVVDQFATSKVGLLAERRKKHEANVKRAEAWAKYQASARAALDDLGGTFTHTDAKQDWDGFNDEF